jgi:hypothetical protein
MHAVGNSLIQCRGVLYEGAATALRTAFRQIIVFPPHRVERASLRKWHARHWDVYVLQNFFLYWVRSSPDSCLMVSAPWQGIHMQTCMQRKVNAAFVRWGVHESRPVWSGETGAFLRDAC